MQRKPLNPKDIDRIVRECSESDAVLAEQLSFADYHVIVTKTTYSLLNKDPVKQRGLLYPSCLLRFGPIRMVLRF